MRTMAHNGSNATVPETTKKVVICGAGIVGSSVAYYLSLHGVAATVVERSGVACAASGKAGGFLAYNWSDGSPTGPLQRRSFKLHEELGEKFGSKTGYRRVSTFSLKTTVDEGPFNLKPASKRILPEWLDGGILSARKMADESTTAQVHPEKLTNELLNHAKNQGAKLQIGKVQGLEFDDEGAVSGVLVDGQRVDADVAVIAMGPWTRLAANWKPGIPRIEAQKAHSIVIKPTGPVTPDCLFLAHTNKKESHADPEVYPRPDGTVYVCGEADSSEPPEDPAAVQAKDSAIQNLQEVGAAISSRLSGGELLKGQACFLPLSPDGTPAIGPVPETGDSLYVASGHSCWGILNAPATGEAIADMIVGRKPAIDMADFSPARFAVRRGRRFA